MSAVPPVAHHHAPLRGRALAAFVLVALIWGSTWLVIKAQIAGVPPEWTVTWRIALACVGTFALAVMRGESLRLAPGGTWLALAVGVSQFVGNFQFVYRAEHYLTSGIVAVLYALLLVPNAILARIFLKTPVSGRFLAGSVVAIGGIGLLLWHEVEMAPARGGVGLGVVLALGGLLSASAANVVQASRACREQALVPLLAWAMLAGVAVDAVWAWITTGAPVLDTRPSYWLGVAWLGIAGSVVAFPLYFSLIRHMGAGRAAYNGVAVPVIAMALSTLFEGYRWSGAAGAGAALAMAGLLIALSGRG